MPIEVFTLTVGAHDSAQVVGVFATLEEAKQVVARDLQGHGDWWESVEFGVWMTGCSGVSKWGHNTPIYIDRFELGVVKKENL